MREVRRIPARSRRFVAALFVGALSVSALAHSGVAVAGLGLGGLTGGPSLSGLKLSPTVFAVARSGGPFTKAPLKPGVGTKVTVDVSDARSLQFVVDRKLPGRRVGGRCVAPSASNRNAPSCVRFKPVGRSFSTSAHDGRNTLRFTGRVPRLRGSGVIPLAPGSYRLRVQAIGAIGNRSPELAAAFKVRSAR